MAYIADDIITIHVVVSPYFRGGPRHTPNIYSGLTLILNNVFYYFPNQATTCSEFLPHIFTPLHVIFGGLLLSRTKLPQACFCWDAFPDGL